MGTVIVTNRNEEPYERRYDGEMYAFPPGEAVTIPDLAAVYLFGYGGTEADRRRIVIRNGWQLNGVKGNPHGPDAAMKKLSNFVFKKGPDAKGREKPEKKTVSSGREMTGINAVSPRVKDDGKTIVPHTVRLPGGTGPLAPPAANV